MTGQITSSGAIYNVALQCALHRRNGRCKNKFASFACADCSHYIGRYVDADPRQLELYMYQAEVNAGAVKISNFYGKLRALLLIGLLAVIVWFIWFGIYSIRNTPVARQARELERQQSAAFQPVRNNTTSSYVIVPATMTDRQMVNYTLLKVQNYMDVVKRDVNYDGKVNCEDAAILFYMYYPVKENVRIYVNFNPNTGMNHAFNLVLYNDVWRAIEPQAYMNGLGWRASETFFMRDIWGAQYDPKFNRNAWSDYARFVKPTDQFIVR
jgi:hypothetical protein